MNKPETIIISLNLVVIFLSYFLIYPKFCESKLKLIVINDLIASVVVLLICGSLYGGLGKEFNLLFFSLNWFWFTLLTYALLEIPIALWYFNKYRL